MSRAGELGPGGHRRQLRSTQAKAPSVSHYSYGLRKISRQSDDKDRDSEAEASWRVEREGEVESGVKLEKVSLCRVFWALLRCSSPSTLEIHSGILSTGSGRSKTKRFIFKKMSRAAT